MRRASKTPANKLASARRYRAKWRKDNKNKVAAYNKEYAKKNKKRANQTARKNYQRFNIEIGLARKGLDEAQADAIRKHHGRCDICGGPPDGKWKRLNIDHCEKYLKFRGMLCSSCNRGIGFFKHDIGLFKNAVTYLRKTQYRKTLQGESQ